MWFGYSFWYYLRISVTQTLFLILLQNVAPRKWSQKQHEIFRHFVHFKLPLKIEVEKVWV